VKDKKKQRSPRPQQAPLSGVKRPAGSKPFSGKPNPASKDRPMPTEADILAFIATSDEKAGKREIARAFGIKGQAKIGLKRVLSEMAENGRIKGRRKNITEPGKLPPVTALEVIGRDNNGDLIAEPLDWSDANAPPPKVLIVTRSTGQVGEQLTIGPNDHILAKIKRLDDTSGTIGIHYEAEPIRKLARETRRLLGIYRAREGGGGTIEPISRKDLKSWTLSRGREGDAKNGDLVRFDIRRAGKFSTAEARILESLGNPTDERKISLIAIHAHGIPEDFPAAVMGELDALPALNPKSRTDLRATPLITIDPQDARDHDDAVYSEPDTDPRNAGGFIVIVAIADVAHYVRPATKIDREAELRGNSVYFPDRVVPMLPEKISNDLCSLREGQDRPCLAVRMVFDSTGEKRGHTFTRAIMRSAAKLSYEEAQAAIDGAPSDQCKPILDSILKPLWAAYAAMKSARDRREPLDLDLPERKIKLDAEGRIARIYIPERLDAHKLIEEMMIQANVAAAETLEGKKLPVVYRIHDRPSQEKLRGLREFLETLGLKVPPAGQLKAGALNRVLTQAKSQPAPELVNEVVLRSQAQAEYNTDNIGHFGLNLARYAHFTSPIRRYADLLVHRALVRALKLGDDGLDDDVIPRLDAVCQAISTAERRAMAAERETTDRLIATHLADRIGAEFEGRIAGVTRSGLFIKLKETGADGFVPISTLGADYFNYNETAHALVGSRSGQTFQLGDQVTVKLLEVVPSAGALRFEMVSEGTRGTAVRSADKGFRGRQVPRNRRPYQR
jgi:ribonuclease R